jgi:hypothetical protein
VAKSKVECEVEGVEVEFNGRDIDGVEVTCTQCGHTEQSGGTSDRSVKRCLALMRENCPQSEENFYVVDTD